MGFGGPHAGVSRDPRRLQALDARAGWSASPSTRDGNPAYRLALQTREQHIRREKATSNICTAQVLLAVMAEHVRGLSRPRRPGDDRAPRSPAGRGAARGPRARSGFVLPRPRVLRHRRRRHRTARPTRSSRAASRAASTSAASTTSTLGCRVDETTTRDDVDCWRGRRSPTASPRSRSPSSTRPRRRAARRRCARTSAFLTHPMFHRYRSETEMLRYLRRLADRDIALDRAMIPLGLVHDEAQRDHRDDPGDLAGVRRRCIRSRRRTRREGYARAGRRPRADAVRRDHRLRGGLAAAERRLAGRVRGPAGDPRVPREPRRRRIATSA